MKPNTSTYYEAKESIKLTDGFKTSSYFKASLCDDGLGKKGDFYSSKSDYMSFSDEEIIKEINNNDNNEPNNESYPEEKLDFIIKIYPNPASDFINIQTNNYPYNISLENSIGEIVLTKDNISHPLSIIDISNLSKGVYFVKVSVNKVTVSNQKMIIIN